MDRIRDLFIVLNVGVAVLCLFPLILTFILRNEIECIPSARDAVKPSMLSPEDATKLRAQESSTLFQSGTEDLSTHLLSSAVSPRNVTERMLELQRQRMQLHDYANSKDNCGDVSMLIHLPNQK